MAIFDRFRRKPEDKVDALIAKIDTPYFPVHNPQSDPSVSDTDPPTFRAMFAYYMALRAIVAIGSPAVERLIMALHHPNLNVRLGVITALGRIGDPSAMETLMTIMRTGKPNERPEAVFALSKIRHADILEQIMLYSHDPDVEVREAAVSALGEMGDSRALPELEIIAHSDNAVADRYGPSIGDLAQKAIKKIRKRTRRQ
jgi:HEAT repeat protein